MSHVKTIFWAALVFSSLALLSPGLFINGAIYGSAQPVSAMPKGASYTGAGAATLGIPASTAAHYIFEIYGGLPPRLEGFLTASENGGVPSRKVIVVRHLFTVIFAPKVSRYISKSVLNI